MTCIFTYAAVGGTDEVIAIIQAYMYMFVLDIQYPAGVEHEPEKGEETYLHVYY